MRLGVSVEKPKCQNTFSINSQDDNILGTSNSERIVGKDVAINNICEKACRNGLPIIPDIGIEAYATDGKVQTVSDLLGRLYNGCCECSAEAQARPTDGSFWHIRMSSQKMSTPVTERMSMIIGHPDASNWLTWGSTHHSSKWWTPRSYDRNNLAAKVNAPMLPAYYAYRKELYAVKGFGECPMGDPSMCENDCAMCKMEKTGYNCAGTCSQCLLGGECDNTPAPDGSTRCSCVSDSLDSRSGCCPMGFSLLTGGDILARDGQVNGIKAGFVTYYERNRGEKYNGATSFYNPPIAPHDEDQREQMGSDFNAQLAFGFSEHNPAGGNSSYPYAMAGYENLKRDQFQAGCYPCPGMFTALSLCDQELEEGELCSEEQTELTQEKMWEFKTELSKEFKDDYNLWILKKLPYQFQPQFFGFPFGYNGKPTYGIYSSTTDFTVGNSRIAGLYGKGDTAKALGVFPSTAEFGYNTIREAQTECDKYEDCLYIANIPPPPGNNLFWSKGKGIGKGMCIQLITEDDTWTSEIEAKKLCYRKATAAGTTIQMPDEDMDGNDCKDPVADFLGLEQIENRKPDAVTLSKESATKWKCWAQWNVDSVVEQFKTSGAIYPHWSTPWQIEASKDTDSGPGRFYVFAGFGNIYPGKTDPELWYDYYVTIKALTFDEDPNAPTVFSWNIREGLMCHNGYTNIEGEAANLENCKQQCMNKFNAYNVTDPADQTQIDARKQECIGFSYAPEWNQCRMAFGGDCEPGEYTATGTTYYEMCTDNTCREPKVCSGETAMWNADGKVDGGKAAGQYQEGTIVQVQQGATNANIWTGIAPFFVGQQIVDKLGSDKYEVMDTLYCTLSGIQYALLGLPNAESMPSAQENLLVTVEPMMKIIKPKFGHTVYTKVATYKDSISYVPEFSEKYTSGGAFSNACGGNQDYCQQVNMDAGGSNKNEDATAVYSYRLGCTQCDVKNVFSIYSEKASVGDKYPIPGFDLGYSFSVGCAKCLPGQGGKTAIARIYEYCYPSGCNQITSDLTLFKRWDDVGVGYPSWDMDQEEPLVYPTDNQKKCNGKLHEDCMMIGDVPVVMKELSWRPGTGCTNCKAGTGFAYDLEGDGIIDDYQFTLDSTDYLYVKADDETQECPIYINDDIKADAAGCVRHHISNDVTHAYGAVAITEGFVYQTGQGQMDPYRFYSKGGSWPKTILCRRCPINSFSTDRTNCMNCPMGKTTQSEGATSCGLCKLGQFFSTEKDIPATRQSKCVDCPPGMYQDVENKISSESLVPDGWFDKPFYKSNYNDLPPFAKGYGGCKVCPPGKFNPFPRQTKCYDCPRGTYDPQLSRMGEVAEESGGDSPMGWSITARRMPRVTMSETCITCPTGSYQDEPGQSSCKYCENFWKLATKEVDNFAVGCEDYEQQGYIDVGSGDGMKLCNGHGTWGGQYGTGGGVYNGCYCTCESAEFTGNKCQFQNKCNAPNERYANQNPEDVDYGSYCGVGGAGTPNADGSVCNCACENNVQTVNCDWNGGSTTYWCPGWDCSTEGQLCPQGSVGASSYSYCCLGGQWKSGSCPSCPNSWQYGIYFMGDASIGRGDRCDVMAVQGQMTSSPNQCCSSGSSAGSSFSWSDFGWFFRRRRLLSGGRLKYEPKYQNETLELLTNETMKGFSDGCISSLEALCFDAIKDYPSFNESAFEALELCYWSKINQMSPECPRDLPGPNQTGNSRSHGLVHVPKPFQAKHPHFVMEKGHRWEHLGDGTYKLHKSALKAIHNSIKLGAPEYDTLDYGVMESVIMGEDLGGTCMTDSTRYDGEGEGGVCTLIYENRGQAATAIGDYWDNNFDPSRDKGQGMFSMDDNKFSVIGANVAYNALESTKAKIIPSWMMHNTPYDCQLNCPRGNYWEVTNVPPFGTYNPGSFTGTGGNEETRWTTEGVENYNAGSWWEGGLACTNKDDENECFDGEDTIYEASLVCPYYASVLQDNLCAQSDDTGWANYKGGIAKFPFAWARPTLVDEANLLGAGKTTIFSKYIKVPAAGTPMATRINELAPYRTMYDEAFSTVLVESSFMGQVQDVQPVLSTCSTCEAGRYNSMDAREGTNVTGCDPCPPATYLPKTGQIFSTKCTVCKPGMYNEEWGQANCKGCPPGRYARLTASVFTITVGAAGSSSVNSVTSRSEAQAACEASNMELCTKAQVVAKGCSATKQHGWTTDDSGYYCPETTTTYSTVVTQTNTHTPWAVLGPWSTYIKLCQQTGSSLTNACRDSCLNLAKSFGAVQFQLVYGSSWIWNWWTCYIYKNYGYSSGSAGYYAYTIVRSESQVSSTSTKEWWPSPTFFGVPMPVGAHCCAAGYECTDCQIGRYSDEEGLLHCKKCQNGKYQNSLGTIECKNCPIGKKGGGLEKTSSGQCVICESGKYNDEPGVHPCKDCATGKYNTQTQRTSESNCLDCASGKYANVVGTVNCKDCEQGKHQTSTGQASCTPCEIGRYSSSLGLVECNNCQAGRWQSATGKTECVLCNPGKYNPDTESTSESVCTVCGGTTLCSEAGAAACSNSPAGKYVGTGGSNKHCVPCEAGKHQNGVGTTSCKNCAVAKYADTVGHVNCKSCPGGQYQAQTGRSSCNHCAAGKYSSSGSTSCSCCAQGRYSSSGSGSCYACGKLKEPNWPYARLASAACGGCSGTYAACHPCWGGFGIKPIHSCCGDGNGDGCGARTLRVCWPTIYYPRVCVPRVCIWGVCAGGGCAGGGVMVSGGCTPSTINC